MAKFYLLDAFADQGACDATLEFWYRIRAVARDYLIAGRDRN